MRKENCMLLLFAGVASLFFTDHTLASAADNLVVIPLFTKATCNAPDEVQSAGQCWKDRNLGASQVATASNDSDAYGDLYQWGRPRDGHQNRTSGSTSVKSEFDDPEHGDFITVNADPFDWRYPQNDNLWQGLGGINNPCPQGFRLPTETELNAERISWVSNDANGAFASPLKLVVAGLRSYIDSIIITRGYYWSSTVDSTSARNLIFESDNAFMASRSRAFGFSVRCIKD